MTLLKELRRFNLSARLHLAGLLQYSHEKGEKGGSLSFKFNLVDPEGNKLIDQSFFISVLSKVPLIPAGAEVLLQVYPCSL